MKVRIRSRRTERTRHLARSASFPVLLASMGLALLMAAMRLPALTPLHLVAFAASLALVALGWRADAPLAEGEDGELLVEDATLVIDAKGERRRIPRAAIDCGWIDETDRAVIRLRDGTDFVVEAESPAQTAELLVALGLDAAQHAARFRIPRRMSTRVAAFRESMGPQAGVAAPILFALTCWLSAMMWAGFGAVVWDTLHNTKGGPLPLAISGVAAVAFTVLARLVMKVAHGRTLTVGTDGLSIHGVGRARFIPYAAVRDVSMGPYGLVLQQTDGTSEVLGPVVGSGPILRRIEEAMRARQEAAEPAAALDQLDRQGRTAEAWREELEKLARGASYRGAAFPPERLAEVVADPAAPPDRRVGAAVVLARSGDETGRKRVRIAIDACADDELRAALEQAAEGEIAEAEIERAMTGTARRSAG